VSTTAEPASPARQRLARVLLVLAAIVAGLATYGLGNGGTFYFRLAAAPFAPAEHAPYYRESLLHVGLARVLGFTGDIEVFRVFVLSFYWLGLVRLVAVASRRLSLTDLVLVVLVATFHPAAMIAHSWTCHPDALTYLLTLTLLFARRPLACAGIAALGAWTHLPMWLGLCASAIVLWFAFAEPRARPRALAVLGGCLVGALTCKLALLLCGIAITEDRFAAAAAHPLPVLLRYWTDPGWPILYTLSFAHFVWLPSLLLVLRRVAPPAVLGLLATQALALGATFFTEDTTRVFAFLAFGPLVYGLVRALEVPAPHRAYFMRPLVLVGVLVTLAAPKYFAWKGRLHDLDASRAHLRSLVSAR
jgi:hypothetical protein